VSLRLELREGTHLPFMYKVERKEAMHTCPEQSNCFIHSKQIHEKSMQFSLSLTHTHTYIHTYTPTNNACIRPGSPVWPGGWPPQGEEALAPRWAPRGGRPSPPGRGKQPLDRILTLSRTESVSLSYHVQQAYCCNSGLSGGQARITTNQSHIGG
jgi:hypothetical protein